MAKERIGNTRNRVDRNFGEKKQKRAVDTVNGKKMHQIRNGEILCVAENGEHGASFYFVDESTKNGKQVKKESIVNVRNVNRVGFRKERFFISNRYSIRRFLGNGRFGVIVEAYDKEMKRVVAIKRVKMDILPNILEYNKRVLREIEVLRKLKHPNILSLWSIDSIPTESRNTFEEVYMVTEKLDGNFLQVIRSPKFTSNHIKASILQVLLALEHCHVHGVIHRDIKPENIFLYKDGQVKLGDFGWCTTYYGSRGMYPHVCSLPYRSPEALLGDPNYGPSLDIWALGCVLGEAICGRPIFYNNDLVEHEPRRDRLTQFLTISSILGLPERKQFSDDGRIDEGLWKMVVEKWGGKKRTRDDEKLLKKKICKLKERYSDLALDLMVRMLEYDKNRRITANQAIRHPYFDDVRHLFPPRYSFFGEKKIVNLRYSDISCAHSVKKRIFSISKIFNCYS